MEYTTNLGLKKPAYSDPADIVDLNNNMDTIDAAITETNSELAEVNTELPTKVDKVPGKGLSTNDFTNANRAFVDNFTIVNDEICMEV